MSKETQDLIVVGAIKGAHGVRGEVKLKSFTADPDDLFAFGALLDESGTPLLTPQQSRAAKDHYIVKADPFRQKEEWDALKGTLLHVPRSALPEPDEDELYIADLIGLTVLSDGKAVGRVKSVQDFGAGDLIEVQVSAGGPSIFVPFTKADVPEVDVAAGTLSVPEFDVWADMSGRPETEP